MKSRSADGSLLEYISSAFHTLLDCDNLESLSLKTHYDLRRLPSCVFNVRIKQKASRSIYVFP